MTAARVQLTSGKTCVHTESCARLLHHCSYRRQVWGLLLGTCTEVFWTCHLHALSTEVEEVMGLLLGDVLVRAATPLMPDGSPDHSHRSNSSRLPIHPNACVVMLQHQNDGSTTVRIWAAVPQIRTDRRKVTYLLVSWHRTRGHLTVAICSFARPSSTLPVCMRRTG